MIMRNIKKTVFHDDDFICKCGNTFGGSGFSPCDECGSLVEPTTSWDDLYKCLHCSQIYKSKRYTMSTVFEAIDYFDYLKCEVENLINVVFLNEKLEVIENRVFPKNKFTSSSELYKKIFSEAFNNSSSSIMIGYNDSTSNPLHMDVIYMRGIAKLGDMVDIPLRDCIIVSETKSDSLKMQGYL